jgi:superfamily II DNA or RNA helicase
VDVPTVDALLMLRPTESPLLFLQQLGRGLRKVEGSGRPPATSCHNTSLFAFHRLVDDPGNIAHDLRTYIRPLGPEGEINPFAVTSELTHALRETVRRRTDDPIHPLRR